MGKIIRTVFHDLYAKQYIRYGTNVYVYLQRLSHMAQENLPVYNAVSSAKLRNIATQVRDWTDLGNMQ